MEHFTIAVADPHAVPFVRELLLSLPQVQLVEEPALSPEEEVREDAAAQAAYERAKAEPDQSNRPLDDIPAGAGRSRRLRAFSTIVGGQQQPGDQ